MSTAIYLRVSSKGQKLASQKREVQRYLNGHGLTDVRWFVDTISTRKAITERPGLTELRAAIFNGQIDTVILYRLDRLARSIRDGIDLLTDWINAGVRVVITTMQIDLSGALGQTVAALLLGLAQMEREAIRERQAAGIAAWREKLEREGKRHPGGRPRGKYKVDPQRVAELRERGLTYGEIGAALGISKPTVRKMLAVAGTPRPTGRAKSA
jgi:DNA invertase Pin-like site-specific DNA recombinase